MTVWDLLSDSFFQQKKVLEKLLCHYTWLTKEQLITSYDIELTNEQIENIKRWYLEYTVEKKPLEYIMGFVEFFGRKFAVDGRCLIPRPETEYMIEAVNENINDKMTEWQNDKNILIDVGTGCGVLGLSVLLENPSFFGKAFLTEYFPDTLSLAQENYAHYKNTLGTGTDIELFQANLVDFLVARPLTQADSLILIANLPYIPNETFDTQAEDNVRKREPRPAFVWGDDGLDYYREMFGQLFTSKPAYTTTMFLEMMTWQVDILRKEFPHILFEEIKTFHFNIRIVKGTLKIE